uniref:GATA-type domain-containing protein n=1 Tax=Oryza punctata TaxID=4537 RepID=A0A0E0LCV1_ORYPU
MSTIYMSQLSSALPLMEGEHHHHHQDHHQGHFQAFSLQPKDPQILFPFMISRSSSSSSPSDTTTLSYGSDHHLTQQQHQAMLEPQHMIGGSSAGIFATPFPTVESIRDDMIERSPFDPYDTEKLQASCGLAKVVAGGKWSVVPAAKMKITRKMGEPSSSVTGGAATTAALKKPRRRAQAYEDHGHGGTMGQAFGVIRVCSDCNTTKTPLWRSGPCGPKSLCNACGIRQRKARRAMMASGPPASTNAGPKADAQPKVKKEKRADVERSSLPFKKRCKVVQVQDQTTAAPTTTNAAAAMEETAESATVAPPPAPMTRGGTSLVDSIGLSWSKTHPTATTTTATASCSFRPSPVAPGFAAVQDEITDAAMLLMTLSCGLVRS